VTCPSLHLDSQMLFMQWLHHGRAMHWLNPRLHETGFDLMQIYNGCRRKRAEHSPCKQNPYATRCRSHHSSATLHRCNPLTESKLPSYPHAPVEHWRITIPDISLYLTLFPSPCSIYTSILTWPSTRITMSYLLQKTNLCNFQTAALIFKQAK
jgi:hypothetical protein